MLAWSEGTDNGRQKTRNHGYDVIVGGELFTDYSDHPRKLVTLNPNSNQGAGRYQLLPVGGMPTAGSLAWKTSLRKVRTLWHCSRLRSVALYLWLIVVISVRQSTVAAISGLHCRALVMVSSSIRADSLIAKFKEAGGTVRDWCMSRVTRLSPLWLSASSSACHGLLIITVITPLPTKPSATKMPENWSWRTRQLLTCRCVSRDVAALDAKYTKELADAKAENDALRDDVAAGRRRLHIKAVCQSVREATTASGVDNAASPDWQTPLNGIISPSERGWSLCKNNWKNQKYINEQCR